MKVNLGERSYDIVIEDGALERAGAVSAPLVRGKTAAIITNDIVGPLYADKLKKSLASAELSVVVLTVPDGEDQKTLENVGQLCEELVNARLDRKTCIFALGGGVIGDLAGFVAAIYLRGVDFIQVPTSLLAQVDSSVGGKTAVNLPQGKNLVGAFHQPKLVIIDPLTLKTLPKRELGSGLAEIIKHGIIGSRRLFEYLEENIERILALDTEIMASVIEDSCIIKAEVVAADERESNLRAILNCGHTLGHAVETVAGYGRYRHGEAVSIGLVAEAVLAEQLGIAETGVAERISNLLERAGLPTKATSNIPVAAVIDATLIDKKVSGGKIKWVLPQSIGKAVMIEGIDADQVTAAFELCRES